MGSWGQCHPAAAASAIATTWFSPEFLRLIHRIIGAGDEGIGAFVSVSNGHANADGDTDRSGGGQNRLRSMDPQLFGDTPRILEVSDSVQEHQQLVPAEPGP